MWDELKRDAARYGRGAWLAHGFWASCGYRLAIGLRSAPLPALLKMPLGWVALGVKAVTQTLTNIDVSLDAEIGPGLMIPHTGYVVVGSGAVLGANVTLTPGVVLGHRRGGTSSRDGSPRLGDRVYVGPGAKLVGPIEIGDDALIGVNAVVLRDVPARAVLAGNPARQVGDGGAFDLVLYPGMEADPARQASLVARDGRAD